MITLFPGTSYAKPFLKWAGGKSQLLPAIEASLPPGIAQQKNLTYIEPFIGSGAMFFWFLQKFPQVKKAVINDVNTDLIEAYITIKENPHTLIERLKCIQSEYYMLSTEDERKNYFLEKREEFNARNAGSLENTALLIFLNRTCFNGLYRVNSRNQFNVPFGRYNKPRICDVETIQADSELLQRVIILNGDYQDTLHYAGDDTFFYFDPPYRPISKTASFNAYAKDSFNDLEQERLKQFCDDLTLKGHQWLLSNSDPRNVDPGDDYFDILYSGSQIFIERVKARRAINSNSSKRGEITELLISNYAKKSPLPFNPIAK